MAGTTYDVLCAMPSPYCAVVGAMVHVPVIRLAADCFKGEVAYAALPRDNV
jgi:hypothetical protein